MDLKARIKKTIKETDKYLPRSFFYAFIMKPEEKKLFDKRIRHSLNYLEFGMGGSTFRVLSKSKTNVFSIDSSVEWISLMREYRQIRNMEKGGRLSLFHVDIGPTGEWGMPINDNEKEKFPDYSAKVFDLVDKQCLDTILIDGRFRVACTLKSIIECQENKDIQIIIHDFFNRPEYHIVLDYLDVVEQAHSLGVFKIKKNIDLNAITKHYEEFKYIAD